jgi:RNA polymerase sigma-70 factor (ECF subfamily)
MNSGVTETLRMVYTSYREELYTYAVSITRDRAAAEDAIHAAFQRLLTQPRLPTDLRPYVFRAVRNAAIDSFRRHGTGADDILKFESATSASRAGDALLPEEVESGLRELSSDERETIVLKLYDGLTFQEIADVHGAPPPTVASWYRRGLEKLRARLAKELS